MVLAPAVVTTEPLLIRARGAGMVSTVNVKVGAAVNSGQVLLSIRDDELETRIAGLQQQLDRLIERVDPHWQQIIYRLENNIKIATQGLEQQKELTDSYQEYKRRGVVPNSDMAVILQTFIAARMRLQDAQAALAREHERQAILRQSGPLEQSRRDLQRELAILMARQTTHRADAPFPGKVADILVQPGENVEEHQPLLWLSGREKPVIVAYLEPKHMDYAQQGGLATVRLPNGEKLSARVSEPVELVSHLPGQLKGPFDGEKPALKVVLSLTEDSPTELVEKLPVEVRFHYFAALN